MWKTLDIVPSSIRNDPQVISACDAIDRQLAEMYEGIPSILFWPFVDQQVPPLLDILAWEMHVDVWAGWDGELTTEQKVELINKSIDWHRHKGTVYAVEDMLQTVFRKGRVQEWYEYGGRPYYFRVVLNEPFDAERWQRAYAGILAVKNVRSWMEAMAMPDKSIPAQMYVSVMIGQRVKETWIPISTNERLPISGFQRSFSEALALTESVAKSLSGSGVSVSFQDHASALNTTASPVSFTGRSFGTAAASRVSVVFVASTLRPAATGVTINGVAASQVGPHLNDGGGYRCSMWRAANPTGTTGTIDVAFGSAVSANVVISNYSLYGVNPVPSDTDSKSQNSVTNASINALTIPSGGVAVIGGTHGADSTASVWTGASSAFDVAIGTSFRHTGATITTPGTPTITMSSGVSDTHMIIGAAFGP